MMENNAVHRKTINQGYKEEARDMYTALSCLAKHRTV